jgi:hypothetical protein
MSRISEDQLSTRDFVATGDRAERRENELRAERRDEQRRDENVAPTSGPAALLSQNSAQDLRSEWDRIQAGFVDDPRKSVKQADELVATAMKRLAESFAQQRSNLERQWDRGDEASTEDLRVALQKYRSFFQRLLAVDSGPTQAFG